MEKAKLIVKNFGPLKDIEIEVREMITFIGAQASGKSTLAKLLSIFEDENFRVFTVVHNFNPDFTPKKDFTQCLGCSVIFPCL
jgi:predicted ATPase